LIAFNRCLGMGEYGGGVHLDTGGTVENCTITSNQSADRGGGVACIGSTVVRNSIIYGNTAITSPDVYGGGTLSYCCTPLVAGVGNTTNDPTFVSGFRIGVGSPCLNAGTNLAWMLGATDLDGSPRIVNGTVDMGAYEAGFTIGLRYSAVDVTWNSVSGVVYQVQSSTNILNSGCWTNVGSSVTATTSSCYAPDWIRNYNGKCYRVLELQ
jgi:hypothetical protein